MAKTLTPRELSQQPLPTKHHPLPSGNWNDIYKLPAIAPSAADVARCFHPTPANAHPTHLFSVSLNICSFRNFRFISKTNRKQVLLFIDGACSNNGAASPRGGCGVVYSSIHEASGIALPLEKDGKVQTSNRAELRAALLAIGLRLWSGEGFDTVVLACDSEYVVRGATEWLPKWERNGWKTARGEEVKNRDLWEALRAELRRVERDGLLVQFWRIPREYNEADAYAKDATKREGMEQAIERLELIPAASPPCLMPKGPYGLEYDGPGSKGLQKSLNAGFLSSGAAEVTSGTVKVSSGVGPTPSPSLPAGLWQTRGEALAEEYGFSSTGDDEMDMMIAIGLQDLRESGEIDSD